MKSKLRCFATNQDLVFSKQSSKLVMVSWFSCGRLFKKSTVVFLAAVE